MNQPQTPRTAGQPANDGQATANGATPQDEPSRQTRPSADAATDPGVSPTPNLTLPAASPGTPAPARGSRWDGHTAKLLDWPLIVAGSAFGAELNRRLIASGHTHLSYAAAGLAATLAGALATRNWLGKLPVRAPIIAYAPAFLPCLAPVAAGVAALLPNGPAALMWGAVTGLFAGVAGHVPLLRKHHKANVAAQHARTTASGPPASAGLADASAAPPREKAASPDPAVNRSPELCSPPGDPDAQHPQPPAAGSTP